MRHKERPVLKNGATMIARREEFVLAKNLRGEWVTWATDKRGNTFSGHYFGQDFQDAVNDFFTRR